MMDDVKELYDKWKDVKAFMYEAGWRHVVLTATVNIRGTDVPVEELLPLSIIEKQYDEMFENALK